MEWDQYLFRKALHFFQRFSRNTVDEERLNRVVLLEELQDRLELVAKALTGHAIQIKLAEREGGFHQHIFFLPKQIDCFSTRELNVSCYLFRICFLTVQRHLGINLKKYREIEAEDRLFASQELAQILSIVMQTWPGFRERCEELIQEAQAEEERQVYLYGRKIAPSVFHQLDQTITSFPRPPDLKEKDEQAPQTELVAPPCEELEQLQVDKKAIQDYTLMHNFEKVETLDEFRGRWRDMDGDDDLEEHTEALEELNLHNTVRTDVPTHSIYQADFLGFSSAPESEEKQVDGFHHTYPEWDYKRREYRKEHCKVFPRLSLHSDAEYIQQAQETHSHTMRVLRKKLQNFHNEREMRRWQTDGESPDLDAVIDTFAELKAGRTPHEKVYLSSRKRRRDAAVLILLDTSLSTDAYTNNQRILDVEKQSVILFSQLLNESHERFQIDAFHSRTRNQCYYYTLKKFGDDWSSASAQVGGIQPAGYTRIGPALRHATSILAREKARHKWLLLLSDGKPNDYDRYEGTYGIHDVRQSIREAFSQGIHTYALAIEKEARHYLPRMLGPNNYRILPHPEALPDALLYFYTRMLGRR